MKDKKSHKPQTTNHTTSKTNKPKVPKNIQTKENVNTEIQRIQLHCLQLATLATIFKQGAYHTHQPQKITKKS